MAPAAEACFRPLCACRPGPLFLRRALPRALHRGAVDIGFLSIAAQLEGSLKVPFTPHLLQGLSCTGWWFFPNRFHLPPHPRNSAQLCCGWTSVKSESEGGLLCLSALLHSVVCGAESCPLRPVLWRAFPSLPREVQLRGRCRACRTTWIVAPCACDLEGRSGARGASPLFL